MYKAGRSLAKWRKANDVTQPKLAEAIGVTPIMISRYERGAHRPSPDVMLKIERLTNIAMHEWAMPVKAA